jgi:hypothetical protein
MGTHGTPWREEPVAGPGEWRRLAADRFGIDLDQIAVSSPG